MSTYLEQKKALSDWIAKLPGVLPHTLYSAAELLKEYDPQGATRMSAYNVGKELNRQKYALAAGGLPCRLGSGQARLWIVRELSEDKCGSQTEAAKTYTEERGQ